ncbi:type II toxin-antitoxin system PemK/MazF family toxin [Paenibacillus doosanensis]|uniref:type II toxin-antitoxin system PemK/MazF family toxin n=1 Tax=Paenibacillus doosanensis TaxID=1229154 RepID=UPI00287B820C|nr:type II toxin-antitoxin system PemK/MazF family toxin [Paenibacillus doosanensis]
MTGIAERGSIVWFNHHPTRGHEQNGYRASIVISDGIIDPTLNQIALTVPVTTQIMGHTFEFPVPRGIGTPGTHVLAPQNRFSELSGVVLINNVRTVDLAARNAIVIGRVDPESEFFIGIIDRVMAIMSFPEDDEEEWEREA